MRYKNIAGRFFGLVTKHACNRRTDGRQADRITTPKTALAQLCRAAKTISSNSAQVLNTDLDGGCDQHCRWPLEVYDTRRRTKLTAHRL